MLSISYATVEERILNDDVIDKRVKNLVDAPQKHGTSMAMTMIENNINKLISTLTDKYKSELVVTPTPTTAQEKLTYSLGILSEYLCLQKSSVMTKFDTDLFYNPDIDDVVPKMGGCYIDNKLTYQEAITYYIVPDVGTLETVHIPLAQKLGYKLEGFESYLKGDILDMQSEQFFFEEHTAVDIIPLMNLTDTKRGRRRKDEFDMMKVIAYVETTNYPFFDDTIMIAVLARQGDNYIKITTPYQKIRYKELGNITKLVKELFYRSVEHTIGDAVVSNIYFDQYYYTALKDLRLEDSSVQKNKVRQYLTVLRQNDIEPQGYIDFFVQSLKKDTTFIDLVESQLQPLDLFID